MALAWLLLAAASPAAAQSGGRSDKEDDPFAGVEVMEVVGSSTSALLQSANPSSMISFDTSDLEAIGATDVADVAAYTPNLEIKTASSTTAVFFIRGVGLADFSANATGSVAVSYDGVPMNSSALQLGQLFDIQSFDVLKGPQSGGSGRNASAGAIKVTSRQPDFTPTANLRLTVGRFLTVDAIDAPQYLFEGGTDMPIVADVLTSRFAFTIQRQDPYITNRCGGLPPIPQRPRQGNVGLCGEFLAPRNTGRPPFGVAPGLPTEAGDSFDMAGRVIFKLVPPDTETNIVLNVHGRSLRQDSTLGEALGTGSSGITLGGGTVSGYRAPEVDAEFRRIRRRLIRNGNPVADAGALLAKNLARDRPLDKEPFSGDFSRIGQTRMDSYGALLSVDWTAWDRVEFDFKAAFDAYDRWRNADNDFTPDVLFESMTADNAWQYVLDASAKTTFDSLGLDLEGGVTWLEEDLYSRLDQFIQVPALNNFQRSYTQKTKSVGGFARFSWEFLEGFKLEAGARYNWEQKSFDIIQFGNTPVADRRKRIRTWQAPTGAISLTYSLTEEVDVFWKYSRGWKAGHYNSNEVRGLPASPEQIDAFEVGMNGSFWDSRVRLSAALFNYAYQNYQVFVFQDEFGNPPSLVVRNADDARVFGADADLTLQPILGYAPETIENLSMTLRFGWLETRFIRFIQLQPRILNSRATQIVEDNSGNPLINSPRFKISGTLEWKFLLSDRLGSLTPRYDFTWSDDIFFDPAEGRGSLNGNQIRGNPKFRTGQPAYIIHNIRVAYKTPDEHITLAAWCRNLTDTRYKTAAFDVSAFSKVTLNFVGDPRSCGGEIALTW